MLRRPTAPQAPKGNCVQYGFAQKMLQVLLSSTTLLQRSLCGESTLRVSAERGKRKGAPGGDICRCFRMHGRVFERFIALLARLSTPRAQIRVAEDNLGEKLEYTKALPKMEVRLGSCPKIGPCGAKLPPRCPQRAKFCGIGPARK